MMSDDKYIPVSCAQHSEYELAIMHRQLLNITWQDEQEKSQHTSLMPYDLFTEQNCEYLLAKDTDGENKKIRLDKIIEADIIKA